jgi:transposase InsO family protein
LCSEHTGEKMAWGWSSVTEQRLGFVVAASRKHSTMADLCREFQISRQTGYTWLKRYKSGGAAQVIERSRRPERSPQRTVPEIEQAVVELRRRYPDWGAPKLHVLLRAQIGPAVPCERTIHRILWRHELLHPRDRHRPATQRFERSTPNELWQMDFKGPQGFNRGDPVGPLSIVDDHSRYIIALEYLGSTRAEGVRTTLESTFVRAGLPEAMLVDHGTPWWNQASPWGLTELTIWILRQGVRMLYSGYRHPQTQGKVERMHGSLQRAVRRRTANPSDQAWLDEFRQEYNHLRPHAALQMQTPAQRWRASQRRFDPHPREWSYRAGLETYRLAGEGQLFWHGRRWEISQALRRQLVGIEVLGDRALVYFCHAPVRELDLRTGRALPLPLDVLALLQR